MKRRGVDSKLKKVQREYSTRVEKLNKECDNDINSTPFTDALKNKFHTGGIIPVVFGAFGETDINTIRMIKTCAKLASNRSEIAEVTPLNDDNSRGSIYHVMHTQFKRAVGVMATRTAAEIKLNRRNYIRSTIAEADSAAHPDFKRWNDSRSYYWYENQHNEDLHREFWAYHSRHESYYTS